MHPALIKSLRIAVRNWRRGKSDGGLPGREYWDGDEAIRIWIDDPMRAIIGYFTAENMERFFHQNAWNFHSLVDACQAARIFLSDHKHLLNVERQNSLAQAAARYLE